MHRRQTTNQHMRVWRYTLYVWFPNILISNAYGDVVRMGQDLQSRAWNRMWWNYISEGGKYCIHKKQGSSYTRVISPWIFGYVICKNKEVFSATTGISAATSLVGFCASPTGICLVGEVSILLRCLGVTEFEHPILYGWWHLVRTEP